MPEKLAVKGMETGFPVRLVRTHTGARRAENGASAHRYARLGGLGQGNLILVQLADDGSVVNPDLPCDLMRRAAGPGIVFQDLAFGLFQALS
jgi:hypothetical protein